jgi:hypothetical protein
VVSGTAWSTPEDKAGDWLDDLADEIGDRGLARLYARGRPVRR